MTELNKQIRGYMVKNNVIPDFCHLHVHTEQSLLDGIIKIDELPKAVKEMGMKSIAITDHGSLAGTLKFNKQCKEAGVKPIIGLEAYAAEDRLVKDLDSIQEKYYHILLLSQNETGRKNLNKLITLGNRDGYYYKGRLDDKLLEEYNEGLIATSSCLGGKIAQLFKKSSRAAAEKLILYYKDMFKDRFFLELQFHPTEQFQVDINKFLLEVSAKYDVPPIITCDCHYLRQEDGVARDSLHEQILAIQTNSYVSDEKRFSFDGREHWVKNPKEIYENITRAGFPAECMTNTTAIADMCSGEYFDDIGIGKRMPIFPDIVDSPEKDLERLAKWGLVDRFGGDADIIPQVYKDRLKYELEVVEKLGFASYFLIVKDICDYVEKQGDIRGPGRGSGVGSLILWSLGVTAKQLDPVRLGLPFERFLNPHRKSPPDVDLDFMKAKREDIFNYLRQKYGEYSCAHMGTYGEFKPRSIIRDLARVQGYGSDVLSTLSKLVPEDFRGKAPTMDEAIKASPELEENYPNIVKLAKRVDRMVSRGGVHASGFIIYHDDLSNHMPVYRNSSYDAITQMDMHDIEELGFIKFDILGVQSLDVIKRAIDLIRQNHGITIDLDELPIDDTETFDLICSGKLAGVFQLEESLRNIVLRVQPRTLEDLSVINAIGRPGPLDAGLLDTYLECRKTGRPPEGMHPGLAAILNKTYYTFVYQEQVMKMAVDLAGFSMPDSDSLRKAIGKKLPEEMAKWGDQFINGCVSKKTFSKSEAEQLWTDIKNYADYCFNASHSYAYSLISYWDAWLKTHYPTEFMTALMSEEEKLEKLANYISEAKEMDIEIIGPDINESHSEFLMKKNSIVFGLSSIKGLGKTATYTLMKARGSLPFKDFWEFIERVDRTKFNSTKVTAIIKAGGFDRLGYNRQELLEQVEPALDYLKSIDSYYEKMKKCDERDQLRAELQQTGESLSRFRALKRPEKPVKPEIKIPTKRFMSLTDIEAEREVLGCYLSAHPSDFVTETSDTSRISDIFRPDETGKINVSVNTIKEHRQKNGQMMAFLEVEDKTGRASVTVFSSLWRALRNKISNKDIIRIMYKAEDVSTVPLKLVAQKIRKIEVIDG